ncbi:MAG: asparagine synthase (glutamine-hydrolyzing) [Ignavibacteria bacterium]|nr:asparagine synthase (glutamine-hydrolyzing) [Ignavibacteria bacterium]
MCGIAGIIDARLSTDDLRNIGQKMLEVSRHRGPDNRGVWGQGATWLGHNRLSIIDLSAASHQPMEYRKNTMTFNGEIYNYLELREELQRDGYTFTTAGDTEVVLAAYDRWGHHCVDHFIGMWALAIWNPTSQELFCSRDRFGIKPFHYLEENGRFYFASEIKSVKQSPLFVNTINEQQVVRGLYLGWMHHWEETYFECIKSLPAAHNLVWRNNKISITHYATLSTAQHEAPFQESVEAFRELFINSVQLTARRDVAMGVCLSGGLDSTSIASVLASQTAEHDVKTFTAFYTGKNNVDERPYINHVLQRYPTINDFYISPTDNDVAEVLHNIVGIMDAPLPSSSYVSQYFVMQLAAQHGVKVVLDGQGSDEIMGGYMHSMYRVIADLLKGGNAVGAIAEWNAHSKRQGYSTKRKIDVLAKSVLTAVRDEPQLYRLELARTYPWVMNASASNVPLHVEMPSGSKLNAFLHNLVHVTLLPTLLHTEDLNSMAHSIESRVPFLDHRLVELCFAMPNSHKVHRGETKRVLRAAMRGIVPDEVLDRKDKTGFITPGHSVWLRGALKHTLDGNWNQISDFVDTQAVQKLVAEYRAGNDQHALFVWRLAMLREFLKGQ